MAEQELNKSNQSGELRAQAEVLLSQGRAQLADIQRALGSLTGAGALQARLTGVAAQTSAAISQLNQVLGGPASTLHRADLMALESVVHSSEATALVTEATAHAAEAARTRAVVTTSAATRDEVKSLEQDMFEHKIFDAYLHFSSPEDEAAYREREAEAHKYIDQQLARGTPEGDLNAGGGLQGQMLDAHAHGAGDSPDFMPRWNALAEKTQRQRTAMRAAGQSTEEYDRNLKASVRRFLKDEAHLSDAEIDKRLAEVADPLDAVKPYLKDDKESRHLEKMTTTMAVAAHTAASALPRVVASDDTPTEAPTTITVDAVTAKLKAAGVQMSDTASTGHGLAIQKPAAKTELGVAPN
jgi:hypothetical protein